MHEKDFSIKDIQTNNYKSESLEYKIYNILSKFLTTIFIEIKDNEIDEIVIDVNSILKSNYLSNPEEWKESKIQKDL